MSMIPFLVHFFSSAFLVSKTDISIDTQIFLACVFNHAVNNLFLAHKKQLFGEDKMGMDLIEPDKIRS